MLTVATWLWGDKYGKEDVAKLAAGCRRNIKQPFRFLLITDDQSKAPEGTEPWLIRDPELTKVPGCFARLRMFDPEWMKWLAITELLNLDLDLIVTGELDPLIGPEPFKILQGANSANPCPYNGSVIYLKAGTHPEVWSDFSLENELCWKKFGSTIERKTYYEFPDDQGWIAHKVKDAAGWKAGTQGVYAFQKPGWPKGEDLPKDARIVAFPGSRSPEKFKHLDWVQRHWRS